MRHTSLAVFAALAGLAVSGCFSTVQLPKFEGPGLPVERGGFPHHVFDRVLKASVDAQGRVDYRGLAADRGDLVRYLTAVQDVSPHANPELFPTKADALAYWINAYNAYVLFAVTERPQMKSVNDAPADFFYWTQYVFGGQAHSLYAVENDIVRDEFAEPRIHFALNCASAGCPRLPAEAFTPAALESQLARESQTFCADAKNVGVADNVIRVSQIFEWYAEDFEDGPVAFCRRWGRSDLPAEATTVEFIPYDWSLTAQPGRR